MTSRVLMFSFVLLFIIGSCFGRDCTSNRDCIYSCANNYHELCVNKMCKCMEYTCSATSDCPSGSESGCPPGKAKCDDGKCNCDLNSTNN